MANDVTIRITGKDEASPAFRSAGTSASQLGGALKQVGTIATGFLAAGGIQAGLSSFTSGIKGSIDAASSLNETMSKVGVVFGENAAAVVRWGDDAAQTLGQSSQQALEAAGTFGNLFTALGLSQEAAAQLAPEVVGLASDLASFNNSSPEEMLIALQAGLVGEVEPLRRVGVAINAATVEAKAMALGLADSTGALSESAKVQARWALIMEQTTNAQGDFARTAEGSANKARILSAAWADQQAEMGQRLLPAYKALQTAGIAIIGNLGEIAKTAVPVVAAVGAMGAVMAAPAIIAFAPALAAAAASAIAAAGPLGLVAAAVVGIDLALRRFTGGGIMDHLFGGADAADQLNDRIERTLELMRAVDPEASAVSAAVRTISADFDDLMTLDNAGFVNAFDEMRDAIDGLSPNEQIAAVAELRKELDLTASGASAFNEAFADIDQMQHDQMVLALEDAMARASTTAYTLTGATEDSFNAFGIFAERVSAAEDQTKELTSAFSKLGQSFLANDPEVIGLNAAIAALGHQIALVNEAGGDTAGLEAQRDVLTASREVYTTSADAVDALTANLIEVLGGSAQAQLGVGNFVTGLQQLGVDGPAAAAVILGVTEAMDSTDPTVAIAAIQSLQSEFGLSADAMAAISAIIGPEIINQIATGIADPAGRAKVAEAAAGIGVIVPPGVWGGMDWDAFEADLASTLDGILGGQTVMAYDGGTDIGSALAAGMEAGVLAAAGRVAAAAVALVQGALDAARQKAQSASPSKAMAKLGEWMSEGYAQGITAAAPVASKAAAEMGGDVLAAAGAIPAFALGGDTMGWTRPGLAPLHPSERIIPPGGNAGGGGYGGNITINNLHVSHPLGTPEQIADAVRTALLQLERTGRMNRVTV